MSNAFNNFGKASPAVFNNSGRPITAMPGLGLGHDLAAAATAGKQHPNPAAKLKTPSAVPATAGGIQAAQNTKAASLISMLTKFAQGGAPVPGPAGIPPAPNSAAVVQPLPPGPTPPPAAAPSPIPANPRQQPPRERTENDDKQQAVLDGILAEGNAARQLPDRSPTRELESDLMTHGKVASESISAFKKFAALYKKSRQDNSKPSRSAMGDTNGLSYAHRKEDHATGSDAWNSLDRFRRKESNDQSFSSAFVDECVFRNMSVDQIADAIIKVGSDFGADVSDELIAGLEKHANMFSMLGRLYNFGNKAYNVGKNVGKNVAPILANEPLQRAGGAVTGGAMGYYGSGEDATQSEKLRNAAIGAAAFGLSPAKTPNAGMVQKGLQGAGRVVTTGAKGYTVGGFAGSSADTHLRNEFGDYAPEERNYYRDLGRTMGASAGALYPVMGLTGAVPLAATTYSVGYNRPIATPAIQAASRYAGQQAGEEAGKAARNEALKALPSDALERDAQGNVSVNTNKLIDSYIKSKFGDVDQYVQQYTNPLFQAFGMDPTTMDAWQRYAMLGGGLTAGLGGLMGNRFMLGLGGLIGAGGMYPHLAGMADPYVRKQFGFNLPGANPYYAAPPTPPQPPAPAAPQ